MLTTCSASKNKNQIQNEKENSFSLLIFIHHHTAETYMDSVLFPPERATSDKCYADDY